MWVAPGRISSSSRGLKLPAPPPPPHTLITLVVCMQQFMLTRHSGTLIIERASKKLSQLKSLQHQMIFDRIEATRIRYIHRTTTIIYSCVTCADCCRTTVLGTKVLSQPNIRISSWLFAIFDATSKCHTCTKSYKTVKPVINGHSQKDRNLVFKTNYRLMQVKSIAEGEHSAILSTLHKLPFVIKIFILSIVKPV